MTAPGRVLDVAGLALPGGADTLALAPLPRHEFDALLHQHPTAAPDGDERLFDPDTLGPALIAACSAAPRLTLAQARAVFDDWPHLDALAVFDTCLTLCLPSPVDRAWWRLERDPTLRLEMDYCGPAGIPHSHYLGGPPVFTDVDRQLALAWTIRRRATCGSCHTREDQWRRDREAFTPTEVACTGCTEKRMAEAQLSEREKDEGVQIVLVPKDLTDDEPDPLGGDR